MEIGEEKDTGTLSDLFDVNEEQVKKISEPMLQLSLALKKLKESINLNPFFKELEKFVNETKESEKLSQDQFEKKYSGEMRMCEALGQVGWVISEHTNPQVNKEWYDLLSRHKEDEIISYFEGDNGWILENIFQNIESRYSENPNQRYYEKSKYYFDQKDYMTSAMYLIPLIERRLNELINFSEERLSYRKKYSREGFQSHMQKEFDKTNGFTAKRFLFLNVYPSLIEFSKRLFVDGEYSFENGIEPPYINRNWLLHGKSCRVIERYECIQLFNALSVIEYIIYLRDRMQLIEDNR